MAVEVKIPNLGYTMTAAKILSWLKSVGDAVEAGEALLEIETDKVNYEVEAPEGGTLRAILFDAGEEVQVGRVVALLGEKDEEIDLSAHRAKEKQEVAKTETKTAPVLGSTGGTTGGLVSVRAMDQQILASPLAKSVARKTGLDLSKIRGSGPNGRIRVADVERYMVGSTAKAANRAPEGAIPESARRETLSSMRKTIAKRLTESVREIPHVSLRSEVDLSEAMRVRQLCNEPELSGRAQVSLTDVFVLAVARCLQHHPRLNSTLSGDTIETNERINVGIAVALDDGLVVPAIERANEKALRQIAEERRELVARAKAGTLKIEEFQCGTFTVSNLGMYDVVSFTSIINPPQSAILSIGRAVERPVVERGAVVIRPMVDITVTVDHRIVDGAMAARFLGELRSSLERPYLLL